MCDHYLKTVPRAKKVVSLDVIIVKIPLTSPKLPGVKVFPIIHYKL